MTDQELVERAFAMHQFSYAPYSKFPVGAALLCEDGTHPNSAGQALIGQAFRKFAEAQESLPETS